MKRLPENIEILFMLIFGILFQIIDGSPFTIQDRWKIVWDTDLPSNYFSPVVQKLIKTVLSVIVVVRCVSTYAYVVFAMLVIFSILKKSLPKLMLPWLLIAGIKSICMTFLEALIGVYVCSAFGKIRKACIEFFISKALELIFAAYMWGSVLNIYQDLERRSEKNEKPDIWDQLYIQRMDFRNKRARSLLDASTLYKTACLNYFEFKDVPQVIMQMLMRNDEMSQDSLLPRGMMLASVTNMGSLDNLKTSQSLGELGSVDLRSTQVFGLEEEGNLSLTEKALKFLKLTQADIKKAKADKWKKKSDNHTIDQDTWNRVLISGVGIQKPKTRRAEIFWEEIPQPEPKTSIYHPTASAMKFRLSLFNIINQITDGKKIKLSIQKEEEEEEVIVDDFLENDDDDLIDGRNYLMSNNKDEVKVQRIRWDVVPHRKRGTAYAKLYKQDFMSVIGPKVFDKACKLPKVTSLTKENLNTTARGSASLPIFPTNRSIRLISFAGANLGKIPSYSSIEECQEKEQNNEDYLFARHQDIDSTSEKSVISKPPESDSNNKIQNINSNPSIHITNEEPQKKLTKPTARKRRIAIKRIRNLKPKNHLQEYPPDPENHSNDSDSYFDISPDKDPKDDGDMKGHSDHLSLSSKSAQSYKSYGNNHKELNKQMNPTYHQGKFTQLIETLITYYDLTKKVHVRRRTHNLLLKRKLILKNYFYRNHYLKKCDSLLESSDFDHRGTKVWKSKVLEAAATQSITEENKTRNNSLMTRRKIALLRFLKDMSSIVNNNKLIPGGEKVLKIQSAQANESNEDALGLEIQERFDPLLLLDVNDPEWTINNRQNSKKVLTQNLAENDNSMGSHFSESKIKSGSSFDLRHVSTNSLSESSVSIKTTSGGNIKDSICSGSKIPQEDIDFICRRMNTMKMNVDEPSMSSNLEILQSDSDLENCRRGLQAVDMQEEGTSRGISYPPKSQESDESISIFYSKAADLTSPLLDMKRFIYPDHIHYSYKHVKKKGFDVDLNGGLPLLVRESLTMSSPFNMKKVCKPKTPQSAIKRRPMDLSFANTNAFAEWQNDTDSITSETKNEDMSPAPKRPGRRATFSQEKSRHVSQKSKSNFQNFNEIKHMYSVEDYRLIEKLLKMHLRQNYKKETTFSDSKDKKKR